MRIEHGDGRVISRDYPDPVAKLLSLGESGVHRRDVPWTDYLELGLGREHICELVGMATDEDLNNSGSDVPEVWAPLHAWRALGQLQAEEAAAPLVRLFEQFEDDDWLPTELPSVFSMIGAGAIPALADFLADRKVGESCRNSVPDCLARIAEDHPGRQQECIGILVRQLERYGSNGPTLNAVLISSLIDLHAVDAIGPIRKAFSAERVDLTVAGDVEDVEIELGLRTIRSTPRPDLRPFHNLSYLRDALSRRLVREPRRVAKIGRNDPCPCGSGRKFKKCCLN